MLRATRRSASPKPSLTPPTPARRAMGSWQFFPCIVYSAFARVRTRYRTAPPKRSLARVVDGRDRRKMADSADDHADTRQRGQRQLKRKGTQWLSLKGCGGLR